jgi:hypothetical protein
MLLARSPEERLKMGCSMGSTARALARGAMLAQDPHASAAALRRAIFLRFYGQEFDERERERIMERLGRDKRRIPVDWDGLETALTTNDGESSFYLDLRTGQVELAGPSVDTDVGPPAEEIDAGVAAGHLILVEPLGSRVEYGWMVEFAETVGDERLRGRLDVALEGRGAFRRFKHALMIFPGERERWFAFQAERLRAAAREWLAAHEIEATSPPEAAKVYTPPDRRGGRIPENRVRPGTPRT